ncbi:MAG: peptidoglycan-binding protein, partial [Actinomycetota bacterium]|nr:peptidoglycan-binding protein [Actinomycetota bacterium]
MRSDRSVIRRRTTLFLVLLAFVAAWAIPSSASAASFGSRSLKVNTRGKDVKALQRALTTLGFSTRANGVFGPPTRKSVKRLEKRQRWPINGVVTRKDAKRILKLVARRKAAKATTVYYLYGGNYPTVAVSGAQAGAGRLDVVDVISGQVVAAIPVSFSAVGQQDVIWSETTPSGG